MLSGLQVAQSETCVPSTLRVELPRDEIMRLLLTAVAPPVTVAVIVSFAAQGSVWLNVRRKRTLTGFPVESKAGMEAPFPVTTRRKLPRPEVAAGYARSVVADCGTYVSTNALTPGPLHVRVMPETVQPELPASNAPLVVYLTFLLSSRSRAVTSNAIWLFVLGTMTRLFEL